MSRESVRSYRSGSSSSTQVTALYSAAFDRAPDSGGQTYWTGVAASGVSMSAIAGTFAASSEFQMRYGTLNTSGYVTQLYQNVLHRGPDSGGFAFWTDVMAHGATRGDVLLGFAVSTENMTKIGAAAGQMFA